MFTPRTDIITLFDFAKLLSSGGHLSSEFKLEFSKLTTTYPVDSDRLHGGSSTVGYQTITHDEARYYCEVAGYKIPNDIKESASLESLKEQVIRLTKDEKENRGYLTELLAWLDEEYVHWPERLEKPPHCLIDLFEETLIAGMDCSKPAALIAADKLTESALYFNNCADFFRELERQLREGAGNHA